MVSLRECEKELRERIVCDFDQRCETGLFTMTFLFLHPMYEDLRRFESMGLLDAYAKEECNRVLERSYWRASTTTGVTIM